MEKRHKVETIAEHSVSIIKVFLDALEKFEGQYLFSKAELVYMHDKFGEWLNHNEDCIAQLNQLMGENGNISDGKILSDLYHQMNGIYRQVKDFEHAFESLCEQRRITGITAVEALFATAELNKQ